MKRGFLVFNPSAGTRTKSNILVQEVIRLFASENIEMIPSPTRPDGSVMLQVREMVQERPDLIVTWGGDGTFHEAVNGIFGSGIPIGILPGGTANLMVRELGIPQNVPMAIRIIGSDNRRLISVGQVNERYFLLMVGIGFDSAVIQNVNLSIKRKLGKLAFGLSALQTAVKYSFPQLQVQFDGKSAECVFAVICNARHYAAYFVLTPDADISDDYLYLCLFKDPGVARLLQYAFHALRRTHIQLPSVQVIRAKEILVAGAETIAVQADGELVGSLPLQFSIHPRSLEVFCPAVSQS